MRGADERGRGRREREGQSVCEKGRFEEGADVREGQYWEGRNERGAKL